MDRSGLSVDIVVSQRSENVYEKTLCALGIPLLVLSGNCRCTLKNLRLFRRLLQENRYDVVHLNIYQGLSLLFAREAKRAGIPIVIAHSHNTDLRPSAGRALKMVLHRFCSRLLTCCATALWAPSEAAARFMVWRNGKVTNSYLVAPAFSEDGNNWVNESVIHFLFGNDAVQEGTTFRFFTSEAAYDKAVASEQSGG